MAEICNPLIPALCGSGNVSNRFGSLISSLFVALLVIASLFTLANLLLGGLNWITSGGDKAQLEAARSRIQNALLGLVITASAWFLYIIVTQFLGITPLGSSNIQFSIPSLFGE